MSKIRILPDSVANKIAAGEVVERPASIVKELIENSIDAGASSVKVAIEKAGERLISVLDDGEGMDQDDALLCLEPHATSKIFNDEDMLHIRSFGFRGEALPSIASVAKVSIKTRRRESVEGFEVLVHGGKMISSSPAGCAPGTQISVRDLFFNTPARRKFLRSAATEERHIVEAVSMLSLPHPNVSFELSIDGRRAFSSPANESLSPRIGELFGRELAEALIPVSWTEYGVSVSGHIARRGYTRPSRQEQRTFVNGRPVEAYPIYRGIKEGCGPMLDKGRHHPAILFISLDPSQVDVNVHPAKREVRFRKEFEIVTAVRSAVAAAFKAADMNLPKFETPASHPSSFTNQACTDPQDKFAPIRTEPDVTAMETALSAAHLDYVPTAVAVFQKMRPASSLPAAETSRTPSLIPEDPPSAEKNETGSFRLEQEAPRSAPQSFPGSAGMRVLGLLEDSYIVACIPGGLALVDQHAAHERVLFEKILRGVDGSLSQRLLIPISIELSRSDAPFVERNLEAFAKLGFEIEPFGQNTIKMNSIPAALSQDNAGGLFKDLLSRMLEDGDGGGRTDSEAIARAACSAAVKAHDRLSVAEAEALVRQLARCEHPFSCPHGRPTVINISVRELERRFGRK